MSIKTNNLFDYFLYYFLTVEMIKVWVLCVLFIPNKHIRGTIVDENGIGLAKYGIHITVMRKEPFECNARWNDFAAARHEIRGLFIAFFASCGIEAATSSFQINQPLTGILIDSFVVDGVAPIIAKSALQDGI